MLVLSFQNKQLNLDNLVYPTHPCRYKEYQAGYTKLYHDYNKRHNTHYDNFFWGYTKLIPKESVNMCKANNQNWPLFKECIFIGCDLIGILRDALDNFQGILLNIPDELCLESDFYEYTDVICNQLETDQECWEEIYNLGGTTQVIFPYITPEMIIYQFSPKDILKNKNWSDNFEDNVREKLNSFIF